MHIDWTTVAFEILNFGILVAILSRFLFRPVQRALETRRQALSAATRQAEQLQAEASATQNHYEAELAAIATQATAARQAAVTEGRGQAEALIDDARDQAVRIVEAARAEADKARHQALEAIRDELLQLVPLAATQVIKDMGVPHIAQAYARRGAHTLQATVSNFAGQPLRVEVSPEADLAEIETVIRQAIPDPELSVVMARDPGLVGGVRLALGDHEIESSAGASLRAWYEGWLSQGPGSNLERHGGREGPPP